MVSVTLPCIRVDLAGELEHVTNPPLPRPTAPSLDSAETPMTHGGHGGNMGAHYPTPHRSTSPITEGEVEDACGGACAPIHLALSAGRGEGEACATVVPHKVGHSHTMMLCFKCFWTFFGHIAIACFKCFRGFI